MSSMKLRSVTCLQKPVIRLQSVVRALSRVIRVVHQRNGSTTGKILADTTLMSKIYIRKAGIRKIVSIQFSHRNFTQNKANNKLSDFVQFQIQRLRSQR